MACRARRGDWSDPGGGMMAQWHLTLIPAILGASQTGFCCSPDHYGVTELVTMVSPPPSTRLSWDNKLARAELILQFLCLQEEITQPPHSLSCYNLTKMTLNARLSWPETEWDIKIHTRVWHLIYCSIPKQMDPAIRRMRPRFIIAREYLH